MTKTCVKEEELVEERDKAGRGFVQAAGGMGGRVREEEVGRGG